MLPMSSKPPNPKISSHPNIKTQILYYVFDILYQGDKDLRRVPLYQRKLLLTKTVKPDINVRLVEYFENDAEALFEASISQGLEGIMAKLKQSTYEDGIRSKNWLKIKATQSDEFIICGYTRGTGSRASTFGALVLGSYDRQGQLVFAGHVGTGFDENALAMLREKLDSIKTDGMPLSEKPALNAPTTWVKPELVAEIKFAERTKEGFLRAPVFLRLRDDKAPAEVQVDEVDPSPIAEIPEKKRKPPTDNVLMSILDQLKDTDEEILLEVESHKIKLTHLNKALWPAEGGRGAITKRDLLEYLARVSTYFLPHLKDRPLTLTRYPNGITGEHFFQKHEENAPEFVRTVSLRERNTEIQEYLVCDNLPTLLWLGQLGNIDIHTWFSRIVSDPHMPKPANHAKGTPDYFSYYPDFIVFDIDPYIYSGKESRGAEPELNRKAFKQTGQVALWLRELLVELSLNSFIKTSGRTGLHVFVPVVRHFQFDAVRSAAKTISTFLLQKHPDEITVDWAVAKRSGKIFLDYNQNVRGKTLASIYSPRPSPEATVSAPIYWDDIGKVYPTDFTLASLPDRLERIGDIWSDILASKKDLDKVIQKKV